MKRFLVLSVAMMMGVLSLPTASLAAARPANDDFDRARTISTLPFAERFSIKGAGVADDEPDCSGRARSIWYRFTPETDMRFFARVRRADFRSFVSVWTGTRDALSEVFCERYGTPIVDATAGTTYYIRVASGRRVHEGRGRLVVKEAPPPLEFDLTVDPQGTIDSSTERITISGGASCSREEDVYLYGAVRQVGPDRRFITAWFDVEIEDCGAASSWTTTMFGDGVFEEGPASVEVTAYWCSRFECVDERMFESIDLIRT
ncbi:MAG: hypothetical protein ACRDKB_05600 [Actinomycetota bacterium]